MYQRNELYLCQIIPRYVFVIHGTNLLIVVWCTKWVSCIHFVVYLKKKFTALFCFIWHQTTVSKFVQYMYFVFRNNHFVVSEKNYISMDSETCLTNSSGNGTLRAETTVSSSSYLTWCLSNSTIYIRMGLCWNSYWRTWTFALFWDS